MASESSVKQIIIGVAIAVLSGVLLSWWTIKQDDQLDPLASQLLGMWQAEVVEDNRPQRITVTFHSDGRTDYQFEDNLLGIDKRQGTWRFDDGILYEQYQDGREGQARIDWLDIDTFRLIILNNGVPDYNNKKRVYRRVIN